MKPPPKDTPDKPVFDDGAFQQLLSAAFVLQQHKERTQSGDEPESGFGRMLTLVGEVQEQIRNYRLDLQAAAALVARRIREMTEASGAAVGILQGNNLEYFAATGSASGELGARAPFELSLAAECLRTGLVLRAADAEKDKRLRSELCRPLHIRALIAAPILFESKAVGVLEAHFAQPNSFHEQEVRACQLLAALLAEAFARENDLQRATAPAQQPPATAGSPETASVRAALERIKPQLERLAGAEPAAAGYPGDPSAAAKTSGQTVCSACGNRLTDDESFCAICGTSRNAPSTWSSLWDMQREAEKSGSFQEHPEEGVSSQDMEVLPSEMEDIVSQLSTAPYARPSERSQPYPSSSASSPALSPELTRSNGNGASAASRGAAQSYTPSYVRPDSSAPPAFSEKQPTSYPESLFPSFTEETAPREIAGSQTRTPLANAETAAAMPPQASDLTWTSAAKTREWLETEHGGGWLARKWRQQRANIYIAVSAALLVVALLDWGPPKPPSSANASSSKAAANKNAGRKAPPQPDLSLTDQLLVQFGLAEAPSAPAYTGNPDVKVWIDVHTALYHCPGSDLYGKTPGGRFTTQGDAQQDNFQPASRRACD